MLVAREKALEQEAVQHEKTVAALEKQAVVEKDALKREMLAQIKVSVGQRDWDGVGTVRGRSIRVSRNTKY